MEETDQKGIGRGRQRPLHAEDHETKKIEEHCWKKNTRKEDTQLAGGTCDIAQGSVKLGLF